MYRLKIFTPFQNQLASRIMIRRFSIIIFLLLFNFTCSAQQLTKVFDTGLWTGVKIDYKFKKDFTLLFMQDLRLNDNFSEIKKVNTDLGFQYKINKNFKLGTNARYSYALRKSSYYAHILRLNYDFMFKIKLVKKLNLRYRLRFQHEFITEMNFSGYGYSGSQSNLRNKLQFDYGIKKHRIYLNAELFREMKPSRRPYFNQMRFVLGSKWQNSLGELNYAIAYERELGVIHPLNYVFVKIYYTFEFKQKSKKRKNDK